jgi:hypothetical protein
MRGIIAICNGRPTTSGRRGPVGLTESCGQSDATGFKAQSGRPDTLTRHSLPVRGGIVGASCVGAATAPLSLDSTPMTATFRRLAALALGVVTLASCAGDAPTAPPQLASSGPSTSLLGPLLGVTTSLLSLDGLQRTTPLAAPITVSKAIGSAGGTLSIPAAGVTVVVPKGALTSTTTITMTARAGSLVAYDFAPHGITFAKPLQFKQSLKGTNASLLTAPLLSLGYYSDAGLLTKTGGLVSELLGGVVDVLSWSFQSSIPHFSGYIVTCGRRR